MRWMNLEPVIQSEVSQKEKNNYCILKHVFGIQKDGTDDPICRAAMGTQMLKTDLAMQLGDGEKGKGGRCGGESGGNVITIYTQPMGICGVTQGTLMGLRNNLQGWNGEVYVFIPCR